jgi:S-DNA-T family DNA segregation ATPase FtsK/SpoIIIE
VKRIDSAWQAPRAPKLRLLPRLLKLEELPAPKAGEKRVPVGIAEADLQPVYLDFASDPHLIAFGDTECGKTALLRLLAKQISDRYTPKEAAVLVVDYRRGLIGAVGGEHLLEYCGAENQVTEAISQIERVMSERLPGADVTPEQLRNRDWWKGPEVFILVDDYDLVATQNNPISPLVPYLAQAKDVGLHLAIVRRSGGASRAMYDSVLQRLRDLATPGLVMAGDRDEGPLVGSVKPSPQPPGRGVLVTRRSGAALVQLAMCDT